MMELIAQYPFACMSAALTWAMAALLVLSGEGSTLRKCVAPPSLHGHERLPGIIGLKGAAVLLFVAGHLWHLKYWATYPVQLHFPFLAYAIKAIPILAAVSAFLIYRSLLAVSDTGGLRDFLVRKIFRFYPLYVFSVLAFVAFGRMETHDTGYNTVSLFISELFLFRVFGGPELYANPVLWSIHMGVLLCILLPFYLAIVPKRFALPLSIVLLLFMLAADQHYSRGFSLWLYFMVGIIAAGFGERSRIGPVWAMALFLAGSMILVIDLQGPSTDVFSMLGIVEPSPSHFTVGLAVAMLLIMIGIDQRAKLAHWLDWQPLRHMGTISYALFLLHPLYAVIVFPDIFLPNVENPKDTSLVIMPTWFFVTIYLAGSIFWATLAYVLVEKPMINHGRNLLRKVKGTAE